MARRSRGFSLIEALAAVALAGLGIAGTVGGIGAIQKAQAYAIEREEMTRFCLQKMDEVVSTGQFEDVGGTLEDAGRDTWTWESSVENTGTDGLLLITVTVASQSGTQATETLTRLVYEQPTTTEEPNTNG